MNFSTTENWLPREVALEPLAVVARGAQALALARRILDRSDAELEQLRGAISTQKTDAIVAVLGPFELLPWVPDAVYLGHETSAPALVWPIHLTPPFAPDLMERALNHQFPGLASPLALLPQWQMLLPLGETLPIKRALLQQFVEGKTP